MQSHPETCQVNNNLSLTPSGLTMKFVLGYAAALAVLKTNMLGTTRVLLN